MLRSTRGGHQYAQRILGKAPSTNALTAINNDKAYVLDSSIIDPVSDKLLYHRRIESLLVEGALPNILWAYWCPPRVERSMTYA
jgi:hypothetical protein